MNLEPEHRLAGSPAEHFYTSSRASISTKVVDKLEGRALREGWHEPDTRNYIDLPEPNQNNIQSYKEDRVAIKVWCRDVWDEIAWFFQRPS